MADKQGVGMEFFLMQLTVFLLIYVIFLLKN